MSFLPISLLRLQCFLESLHFLQNTVFRTQTEDMVVSFKAACTAASPMSVFSRVLKIIWMEVALVETLLPAVDHASSTFEFLVLLFARTLLATRLSVPLLDHILDVLPMFFVVSLFDFGECAYATSHAALLAIPGIVVKIFLAAPMLSEVRAQTLWALSFAIVRELCR